MFGKDIFNMTVKVNDCYSVMATDSRAARLLEERFGTGRATKLITQMRNDSVESESADDLYDLLTDAILNDAESVSEYLAPGRDDDEFPISVMMYGGVYFVSAPEFDDVGLFRSLNDAEEYVEVNWTDAHRA